MEQQKTESPLSDLMFDWVSILHSKAEGLQAYEKYMKDAKEADSQECLQLLQRLQEQDRQMVAEIRDHMVMMMSQESEDMGQGRSSSQRQGMGQGRSSGQSQGMSGQAQSQGNLENPDMMT